MGGLFGSIHRGQELGIERGRLAEEQKRTGISQQTADETKRQHDLEEWQNVRTHALNMINERMKNESPSSALYGQLHQMAGKFLGAVPGDKNNAKLYQDFVDLHQVHPEHSEAITQSKGGSLFGPPLPPGPGQTPGGSYQKRSAPAPGLNAPTPAPTPGPGPDITTQAPQAPAQTGITGVDHNTNQRWLPTIAPHDMAHIGYDTGGNPIYRTNSTGVVGALEGGNANGPKRTLGENVQSKFIPDVTDVQSKFIPEQQGQQPQGMRPPIISGVPNAPSIPAAPDAGLSRMPAPSSAAQAPGNPIQGHAQIQLPEAQSQPPQVPMPDLTPERSPLLGGPQQQQQTQVAPMPPPSAQHAERFPGSELYERDMREHGHSSPALQALGQSYYPHVAETQFKQQQMQAGIDRLKQSGQWETIPPYMRSQMEFEAYGGKAVPLSSGLLTPIHTGGRVSGSNAPDGQMDAAGRPVDRTGATDYDVRQDKMDPSKQIWQPIVSQTGTAPTAGGGVQQYKKGQVGPIENAVAPGMLGTQTSTSSSTTPEGGHNTTKTVQKVAPRGVAGGVAGGGPGSGPEANITPSNSKFAPGSAVNNQPTTSKDSLGQRVRPFDSNNRLDRVAVLIGKDSQNWKMATNAADKMQIQNRMAQLGIDPNNVTTSMRERAANANLILDHLTDVKNIIQQADKDGDLGVLMTRWNDFLSGKVGTDPTKNHLFSKLMTNREFMATAISMAHGGLRGGSSPQMLAHWETALQAKDAATLLSKLGEAEKWMKGYASMVPKELAIEKGPVPSSSSATGSSSSTGRQSLADIFKKK